VRLSARTAWQLSLGAPSVEVCSQSSRDRPLHSFTHHHFPQDANSLLRQASLSRFSRPYFLYHIPLHTLVSLPTFAAAPRILDLGRNTLLYTWFATAQFFSQALFLHVLVMPAHGAQFLKYRDKIVIL